MKNKHEKLQLIINACMRNEEGGTTQWLICWNLDEMDEFLEYIQQPEMMAYLQIMFTDSIELGIIYHYVQGN